MLEQTTQTSERASDRPEDGARKEIEILARDNADLAATAAAVPSRQRATTLYKHCIFCGFPSLLFSSHLPCAFPPLSSPWELAACPLLALISNPPHF